MLYLCVDFQLTVVIERIMAFSLSSPLAKFLNGLEILLSKAQVSSVSETFTVVSFTLANLISATILKTVIL